MIEPSKVNDNKDTAVSVFLISTKFRVPHFIANLVREKYFGFALFTLTQQHKDQRISKKTWKAYSVGSWFYRCNLVQCITSMHTIHDSFEVA